MKKVPIRFSSRSTNHGYDVLVGKGLTGAAQTWVKQNQIRKVFLVADERVKAIAQKVAGRLKSREVSVGTCYLESSERNKDYRRIFPVYEKLIESGLDRRSLLIAVGGGITGDITGFLAGTYLRGIRWMNFPTSLLAQVDSSVGGKTGVNHPLGKNLIGVFHQPSLVVCDVDALCTLPARERVCGFGEMIKHALAFDEKYFRFLAKHQAALLEGRTEPLIHAVVKSVQWKASIVQQDPLEQTGKRILLNLGHTVGHALEGVTGFTRFKHGEAVIWGLRAAVGLSALRGHLPEEVRRDVDSMLAGIPVPSLPKLSFKELEGFLKHDKKSADGKISFVLLRGIGRTILDRGVRPEMIRSVLTELGARWK